MSRPSVLVVAKAPVPGLAKTRIARTVGDARAAELAAAALLDTLDAATASGMRVVVAMTGDLYAGLWYPVIFTTISVITTIFFLPETNGRSLDA